MVRAQLKMFETIAVLIVFFFLLAIVSVFYLSAQRSSIEDDATQAEDSFALQVVFKALYMPELDCSFLLTQRDNCIDVLKLESLAHLLEDEAVSSKYFEEFGDAKIEVKQIYPSDDSWTLTLYNHEPETKGSERVTQSPVLLFDGRTNRYAFGVMEVWVYG